MGERKKGAKKVKLAKKDQICKFYGLIV